MRQNRARGIGIPLDGEPGAWNAITDVPGIEVGHTTLIRGSGRLRIGKGPVRTGVTVIFPRGKAGALTPVHGGWFSLNGNGEMTGTAWLDESGLLEGPLAITNTHSVGVVRDALVAWMVKRDRGSFRFFMPVVAETWDGRLNDVDGQHVKASHVFSAISAARSGRVAEGNVGGGTGMVCHGLKGGIGTASRIVRQPRRSYRVGALVQANYGKLSQLRIAGMPIGKELLNPNRSMDARDCGSIIGIIATDAPLLPHQCSRLARRAGMGLARMGAIAANSSGDLFLAFSTANAKSLRPGKQPMRLEALRNNQMDALFLATIEAVEEAIINAILAAKDMEGINGRRINALSHDWLRATIKKYRHCQADAFQSK